MKKIIFSGIISIVLCNNLLAKDYGVVNGNYTEPTYNKESINFSREFREIPKDTYLKIQGEVDKKYKAKYRRDLKKMEKTIEAKLEKKYSEITNKKVEENTKKIVDEVKIKEQQINSKEIRLKEFKNLESKLKECERQKVNLESDEIKKKVELATQKALSDYMSEYTKNKDIEYIKNSRKTQNSGNDFFVNTTTDNTIKQKNNNFIDEVGFESDLNLDNFKFENLK